MHLRYGPFRIPELLMLLFVLSGGAVGAQQAGAFRSATHPFAEPAPAYNPLMSFNSMAGNDNRALAMENGTSALASAGVNRILCSLSLPGQTWLGTGFGLKRLDLRRRMVQHYTTLDGIPYPVIAALAAGNRQLFCASIGLLPNRLPNRLPNAQRTPPLESAALCQFETARGKWKVLAEEPLLFPDNRQTINSTISQIAAKPRVIVNSSAACLVPGTGIPGKTFVVLVHMRDGAVERLPTPDFLRKSVVVTTAQMDDHSLWLGTGAGLLRYDLAAKRWETLFARTAIYSSVDAEDGTFWILAKTSGPEHMPDAAGMTRKVHWSAVHFVMGQPTRTYPLLDQKESANQFSPSHFENLIVAEGKIWWTLNQHIMAGHGQFLYLPDVYSLNPATGRVTHEVANPGEKRELLAGVPPAVLANAHSGWGYLMPSMMPERFPGWFCHDDARNNPPQPLPDAATARVNKPSLDWNLQFSGTGEPGSTVLVHRSDHRAKNGFKEERFTLGPGSFSVHDEASFPVFLGDKMYFLSGTYALKLRVWNRTTGTVATPPLAAAALVKYRASWTGHHSMLAG